MQLNKIFKHKMPHNFHFLSSGIFLYHQRLGCGWCAYDAVQRTSMTENFAFGIGTDTDFHHGTESEKTSFLHGTQILFPTPPKNGLDQEIQ